MAAENGEVELDKKTAAVFKKKGYKLTKKLAQGAFGQVYKGEMTREDPKVTVAVKVMDLEKVGDVFKEKFLPRELAALVGVKHANTCHIYDIIRANKKMYIFMEFCDSGDVSSFLQKNGAIKEPLARVWFTQTAQALNFLHSDLHMAHRDIKIDNIMLTTKDGEKVAKLTDFGFARKCWNDETAKPELSKTFCGTEPYYSPQIVAKTPYLPFAADVWAMGVVLFAMVNNKFPFHFNDHKKMFKEQNDSQYINGRFTREFSAELKDLQLKMWIVSEKDRITMEQVLQHRWIKSKDKR